MVLHGSCPSQSLLLLLLLHLTPCCCAIFRLLLTSGLQEASHGVGCLCASLV